MTALKVCGLRPGDDLGFTDHPRVTHVGFVFVPASRRYVAPADARLIIQHLPDRVRATGVFVDLPPDEVLDIARTCGLRTVQLHGSESPATCRQLQTAGLEVWKALPVAEETPGNVIDAAKRYAGVIDAVLLDAAPPQDAAPTVTGGHGQSFNWTRLPHLLEALAPTAPVWVAGGIRPENAAQLLQCVRPAGLDVSSGVEVDGRKSPDKIRALIEVMDSYDNSCS